jgi:hypothetical protein
MTPQRQRELERLLRKLRMRAFESDKAAALISTVKRRLMPIWDRQAETVRHSASKRLFDRWA